MRNFALEKMVYMYIWSNCHVDKMGRHLITLSMLFDTPIKWYSLLKAFYLHLLRRHQYYVYCFDLEREKAIGLFKVVDLFVTVNMRSVDRWAWTKSTKWAFFPPWGIGVIEHSLLSTYQGLQLVALGGYE